MNNFFDVLKTVCNPETIYNMYSVIETNYVSSGLLFIYFYYIRASSIAFFITVVISRVIQCIYSCYRYLNQEHQGIDKNTFSRSRKSGYFILGSAVVIGWLGFAVLCNQKHIENEYELINFIFLIFAIAFLASIYLYKKTGAKTNTKLKVSMLVFFIFCITSIDTYNFRETLLHQRIYDMNQQYIKIDLPLNGVEYDYTIVTPVATLIDVPMYSKTPFEWYLELDLTQIDCVAGTYCIRKIDRSTKSVENIIIEIVFRGTEEEKSKYADRYIRLVSRCDEKFAQDNMEKLLKMKSAALNSDTKTFNKYMKSMEIKDPQIEIILNTMRLDKTFNMSFRQ